MQKHSGYYTSKRCGPLGIWMSNWNLSLSKVQSKVAFCHAFYPTIASFYFKIIQLAMKKIIIVLSLILLLGCKSKPVYVKPVVIEYSKVPVSEVDANQKKKAYDLGKRVLMICNTSKFIPFTESEAIQSVIQNTTLEKHSKVCSKFRARYGSFIDIKLVEIYKSSSANETMFRYKAIYEHSNANKELRVTINEQNKVSSIKTMEWVDLFRYK